MELFPKMHSENQIPSIVWLHVWVTVTFTRKSTARCVVSHSGTGAGCLQTPRSASCVEERQTGEGSRDGTQAELRSQPTPHTCTGDAANIPSRHLNVAVEGKTGVLCSSFSPVPLGFLDPSLESKECSEYDIQQSRFLTKDQHGKI